MACTANPDADLDAAPPRGTATKQTVSCADMLAALRRDLIRHQYRAQAPAATSTPNHARPVTVRPRRRLNAESRGFVVDVQSKPRGRRSRGVVDAEAVALL